MILESDIKLSDISKVLNRYTFGKDKAAYIVGGEKKLMELHAQGIIRGEKKGTSQNAKWYFNAADVIKFCRHD